MKSPHKQPAKALGAVAASALVALHQQDPIAVEQNFQFLTPTALSKLDEDLIATMVTPPVPPSSSLSQHPRQEMIQQERNVVLAKAMIRRMVYKCLDGKFANTFSPKEIEDALKYHQLPGALQQELMERHASYDEKNKTIFKESPTTWYEALQQLKLISNGDSVKLWKLILDHPMTSYQPMQCQDCGFAIPDVPSTEEEDEHIGLFEVEPTGNELELRGGWFRGRPQRAKVFGLSCPNCGKSQTRWYRSGHPRLMLNPHRWGRLCGEQEDLRQMLAEYIRIPLRLCLPLDWDHIWSEFSGGASRQNDTITDQTQHKDQSVCWKVDDESAQNFALRLDEGIGSWTRVFAIHPKAEYCEDVSDCYLKYQSEGGRVDDEVDDGDTRLQQKRMTRYRQIVNEARNDSTANQTQAKTLNGYVLNRANFNSDRITKEIRKAVQDYRIGTSWWEIVV